ncbi:ATP-binding protein [uncultured Ramlibacter sp.]|uniref:ATP-binding protein n=1 Tax=uncultured Ramlibacter sp. TaxID=260755 RepID=UPI00260E6A4D|nr:ATP-binding protein [uncultured Ramlibacter sp.]
MSLCRQTSCLAVPASLGTLLAFLEATCKEAGLDDEAAFAVRLAGEEACSNIINHAYRGTEPGPILLDVRCDDAQVVLLIEDRAPVFKPADAPPPDLTGDWEQRREGGLGWHLIRQMMDEVRHEQVAGGGNRLQMVKRLRAH